MTSEIMLVPEFYRFCRFFVIVERTGDSVEIKAFGFSASERNLVLNSNHRIKVF